MQLFLLLNSHPELLCDQSSPDIFCQGPPHSPAQHLHYFLLPMAPMGTHLCIRVSSSSTDNLPKELKEPSGSGRRRIKGIKLCYNSKNGYKHLQNCWSALNLRLQSTMFGELGTNWRTPFPAGCPPDLESISRLGPGVPEPGCLAYPKYDL